jgi:hypothetical protein
MSNHKHFNEIFSEKKKKYVHYFAVKSLDSHSFCRCLNEELMLIDMWIESFRDFLEILLEMLLFQLLFARFCWIYWIFHY